MQFSKVHLVRPSFFTILLALSVLDFRPVLCNTYLVVLMFAQGSHVMTTGSVIDSLTNRGHDVTLIVPPNFAEGRYEKLTGNSRLEVIKTFASPEVMKEIQRIPKIIEKMNRLGANGDLLGELSERGKGFALFDMICESMLSNTTLLTTLRHKEFDLMFADILFACPILIAQSLGVRYTTLTTMVTPIDHAGFHQSPTNPSYIPVVTTGHSNRMTFLQRVKNTLTALFLTFMTDLERKKSDAMNDKYGILQDIPTYYSLGEAEMWFINSHFALDYPRPFVPRAVHVGGLTVKPANPLNKDLETLMQQSGDHGVVVFSFGTYIDVMDPTRGQMIADAFASIPQKVLWKKSGHAPANVSDNIKLVDWMPQNDILGHEKTRLFISHCGLNRAFEAIYHAVPLLCIPNVLDQRDVAARIVSKGIGLRLDLLTMSTGELENAIKLILRDKSFQENIDRISSIYRDEPLTPADRVAYWMEYVVRHNGTSHLKSAAMDLNFFQYYLLDVAAFLVLFAIFVIVTFSYVIKLIFRQCKITLKAKSD